MDAQKKKAGRPVVVVPNNAHLVRFPDGLWAEILEAAGGPKSVSRFLRDAAREKIDAMQKNKTNVPKALDRKKEPGL